MVGGPLSVGIAIIRCALFQDDSNSAAVDNFLQPTPKSNLLKKALFHRSGSGVVKRKTGSNVVAFDSDKDDDDLASDDDDFTFKKPAGPLPADQGHILHTIENRLSHLKNVQNNEIRSAVGRRETKDHAGDNEDRGKYPCRIAHVTPTKRVAPHKEHQHAGKEVDGGQKFLMAVVPPENGLRKENDENAFRNQLPVWHSTPHSNENANPRSTISVTKKAFSLCQPSPVLINRYLKYHKGEDEERGRDRKWRLSNEEFGDTKNEANVSVTSSEGVLDHNLGKENVSVAAIAARKLQLNLTFSKSEDVLNCSASEDKSASTYHLTIEDDALSSTSESSLSSMGTKQHSLSIKQVHKMAQLQELSKCHRYIAQCGLTIVVLIACQSSPFLVEVESEGDNGPQALLPNEITLGDIKFPPWCPLPTSLHKNVQNLSVPQVLRP